MQRSGVQLPLGPPNFPRSQNPRARVFCGENKGFLRSASPRREYRARIQAAAGSGENGGGSQQHAEGSRSTPPGHGIPHPRWYRSPCCIVQSRDSPIMAGNRRNGTTAAPDRRLSRKEIVTDLERGARRRRGMSAKKLVEAYRAGTLYDPGEVADLLGLAGLLQESDSLFVAP